MAPLPKSLTDSNSLDLSDEISDYLSSTGLASSSDHVEIRDASPLTINKLSRTVSHLSPRSTNYNPGSGITHPTPAKNIVAFTAFALIGAAMVCIGVWFFFRAPNGGFQWKENDWEDYKSSVLRRKGPNGTTLSGGTASTVLGGGKAYKDYDGNDVESSLGSEMSNLKREMKGKKREKFTGDKRSRHEKSMLRGGDAEIDLEANTAYEPIYEPSNMGNTIDEDMRAYRHEKPARVGGLNKAPESSQWDGSTAPGTDVHSDLLSNQEPPPTNNSTNRKEKKQREYTGGIRKVSHTLDRSTFWGNQKKHHHRNHENNAKDGDHAKLKFRRTSHHRRDKQQQQQQLPASIPEMSEASGPSSSSNSNSTYIQEEARRLQELGRAAAKNGTSGRLPKRDFSFHTGDDGYSQATASEADTASAARREARRRDRREREGRASRSLEKRKSSATKRVPGEYVEYGSVLSDEDHDGDLGTTRTHTHTHAKAYGGASVDESGTKVYHHPIPELSVAGGSSVQGSEVSAAASDYAGERRKTRAEGRGETGYRRE